MHFTAKGSSANIYRISGLNEITIIVMIGAKFDDLKHPLGKCFFNNDYHDDLVLVRTLT